MNRLLFVAILLAIFFGLCAYYFKNVAEEQERVKNVYRANTELLIGRIRKVYADKVETDRTNEELRRAIREDKDSAFNWGEDISGSLPLRTLIELHKSRNAIR